MKFKGPEIIKRVESEEILEGFKETLKYEAVELREKGFEVDDECRIEPNAFKGFYPNEVIERDLVMVKEREAEFKKKTSAETAEKEKRGEMLEMAKTLGFNRHWFNKRLVSVRTSRYDDIFNGVDNLILDTETHEPLAAVDTAVDYRTKAKQLLGKIQSGCGIKYGLGLSSRGVEKKSYKNLPLFIVSFDQRDLEQMSEDFKSVEKNLLNSLKKQSQEFPNFSGVSSSVKSAYQRIGKIFESLEIQ